jgi:hypothetical protein
MGGVRQLGRTRFQHRGVFVADEPSNAELAWRLERIQDMLGGVVGRPEYISDKAGFDYRLQKNERTIAEARRELGQAIKDVKDQITKHENKHEERADENRINWRSLLLTGVLPAVVALLGVLATLYVKQHGG